MFCNSSFIKKYGTHYISTATIGSIYGEESLISREAYFEMITSGINVELYAGFSAIGSINPSFEYNQTQSEIFKLHTQEQLIYSRGATPPKVIYQEGIDKLEL